MTYHKEALCVDRIICDLRAMNHKQAFQIMCEQAAEESGLEPKKLLARLLAWERRNVTFGIGAGIAIPHLVVSELKKPCLVFARLASLIDYNSLDGQPVDLVFMILSPESDGPHHLQQLARVSRMLRDKELCKRLRGADSVDALYALLYDISGRRLAA